MSNVQPTQNIITQPTQSARRDDLEFWSLGFCLLVGLNFLGSYVGVWEPWEVDSVLIAETMVETGRWLELGHLSNGELPFGFWPIAASTYLFGSSEWALRLPMALLSTGCLMSLFWVGRRVFGRRVAWLSVLLALAMPLYIFHTRFALGAGLTMLFTSLSTLGFVATFLGHGGRKVLIGAVVAMIASGLCGGVSGLLIPTSIAGVGCFALPGERLFSRKKIAFGCIVAFSIVGLGWWRAWVYSPASTTMESLFLWADPISQAGNTQRPAFNVFVAQIGVGLFPFGALLPFAFTDVLSPIGKVATAYKIVGISLTTWFVTAFLGPAIGAGFSHYGIFLGAPAVALTIAVYIDRMLKSEPRPLFALLSVLFVALIDSTLKHNPQMLADTLMSGKVDAFPAQFNLWTYARVFNVVLLGIILIYQGGLHRWIAARICILIYPQKRRPWVDMQLIAVTAIIPLSLWVKTSNLNALISFGFWSPLKPFVRRLIVGVAFWLLFYVLIRFLWNLRVQLLAGHTDGPFQRVVNRLCHLIDGHNVAQNLSELVKSAFFPLQTKFWALHRAVAALVIGVSVPILLATSNSASHLLRSVLVRANISALPYDSNLLAHPSTWLFGLAISLVIYALWSGYLALRNQGIGDVFFDKILVVIDRLGRRLEQLGIASCLVMTVVGIWVVFFNAPVATAFTTNFSQKEIINALKRHAKEGEPCFRYRVKNENRSFYARQLSSLSATDFKVRSQGKDRFFAIIPQKELASVDREFGQAQARLNQSNQAQELGQRNHLVVLHNSGSRFLLVSNLKRNGETDLNPISRATLEKLPKFAHQTAVNFEDKIELVGWRIDPDSPRVGGAFNLHLFWKLSDKHKVGTVLANWKIFVHIDAPGQRIHGDHYPVEGLHPTQNWRHEDKIIHDVHRINVKRAISPASFTVYVGFYVGQKRLKIKQGPKDQENRARLGHVQVR